MEGTPAENSNRIVYTKIKSNGKEVDSSFFFSSFYSGRWLNRIGKAILKFDTGNVEKMSFDESDSVFFQPGRQIQVYAGYEVGKEELLYDGYVITESIEIQDDIRPQLVVECRDFTYPATQGRKNAVFEKMKDGDIITKILRSYGLTCTVKGETMEHDSLIQYYCSDWDFVRSRAEANGLVISVEGKAVTVGPPDVKASPVFTVEYGKDLISFHGSLSAIDQYSGVAAHAWDIDSQKLVSVKANPPTANKQGDISAETLEKAGGEELMYQTDVSIPQVSLKKWADSLCQRNVLSRFQGDFSYAGHAAPIPGCLVALAKMGKRFDGDVYVGGVEHTIERELWQTRLQMGLPADNVTELPDVTAPPASGFLPGIEGLHIGKVIKIDEDPLKQYRVQVELPLLNSTPNRVEARLSTLYATAKGGSYFFPEPQDEVVVGFFNNDPNSAVILGSIYNKKSTPPYEPEKKNNRKAFVTREQLKIEFDEEKKVITLSTPGKNSIEIDDDKQRIRLLDQHKNEVVMDKNGVTVNSCKDIVLKAKNAISMEAMQIKQEAKKDVEINGLNVKASAKMGISLKGNATAELSASGQTTVKGGLVMIN